jgi:mono/diheme cytochrome c family protein
MHQRRESRAAGTVAVGLALAIGWGAAISVRASVVGPVAPVALGPQDQADQTLAPDQLALQVFETFQRHCIECHGEPRDGGLDLRTDAGLQKGGFSGRAVVAHDPGASLLLKTLMHDSDLKMPKDKDQLPASTLILVRQWIEAGASWATVPAANVEAKTDTEALRAREERPITEDEREYWAFTTPVQRPVPSVTRDGWSSAPGRPANPIDGFILDAMTARGLTPVVPADRRTLVRRAYLDVLGLPPTPEESEAFVNDSSPDAWSKLVDRLLASPHYGERWARHWMDLARYADSGGYEFDTDRPEMYRYRDYLINAFNNDKPYDTFVKEQLAGDEIAPESDEAMIATGFLRLGPEGGGNRLDAVDDLVVTTTLTYLGMTVGCARCHNHKFDPIPQKDYYQIQSIFYPTSAYSHPLVPSHEVEANRADTRRIDDLQKPLRDRKSEIEQPYHQILIDLEIEKLPPYLRLAWDTPADQRTEGQRLNVKQIEDTVGLTSLRKLITEADVVALMPDEVKVQHAAVTAEITALDRQKPGRVPSARAISERGRTPEPVYFRGSPDAKGSAMTPGVLSVATRSEWTFPDPPPDAKSSWRRRGFAEWLVSRDNPLTARVMVNRLWQHHFGEGIVRTPSSFGKMGQAPSHPDLLDWLAVEFMEQGWSMKAMHRLMLTSQTYQMASMDTTANYAIDPENRMFWRMPRVRLEAEIIRDTILASAGTLDTAVGGPSIFPYIDPDLFEKSSKRDWNGKPDSDPSTWRRSLYVFSKRSIRYPMFETFDQPNLVNSIDRRNRTTIAPQALILMNNQMVLFQAGKFAERVRAEAGADPTEQVRRAVRLALGRPADRIELERGAAFIAESPDGLAEFCHILFNLNEFLYRP